MTDQEEVKEKQEVLEQFEGCLLSLNRLGAKKVFEETRDSESPFQTIDALIIPVLQRIGTAWEQGRLALSQVYMSGKICEELVDTVLPSAHPMRKSHPKMAISVLEDYHLLGKRIVYSVLRSGGFEVLDFGQVGVTDLVRRTRDEMLEVLLISTLMLPSALKVKRVRQELVQANRDVKIVVGGAPFLFDDHLWKEVGADAVGRNASEALEIVSRME